MPWKTIKKIPTGVEAFDEVIDGGLVPSQSILLGGPIGSRKTSLALNVAHGIGKHTKKSVFYFSSEQSRQDLSHLSRVIGLSGQHVELFESFDLAAALEAVEIERPALVVFDSLFSLPRMAKPLGLAEIVVAIVQCCKKTKVPILMVSDLNRNYDFPCADPPKIVDTVMKIEPFIPSVDGDPVRLFGRQVAYETIGWCDEYKRLNTIDALRVLSGIKNRHGASGESRFLLSTKTGEVVHVRRHRPDARTLNADSVTPAC